MVEDDDSLRGLLRTIVERAGYRVVDVASGDEALAAAAQLPDVVLLNVELPGIDGIAVCERLKAGQARAPSPS